MLIAAVVLAGSRERYLPSLILVSAIEVEHRVRANHDAALSPGFGSLTCRHTLPLTHNLRIFSEQYSSMIRMYL